MSKLLFEDKVPTNGPAFTAKVREISKALGIDPNWLMGAMYLESRLKPQARNAASGATGLIQFMPRTAQDLGTTTAALAAMSNVQQLDYVYKYFKPAAGRLKTWFDLYLWAFFPIAIGKPDSFVLEAKGLPAATIARQNAGFDLNKDGQITKGEVRAGYLKGMPADYQAYLSTEKKSV
jgi:hypothetical protein